MRGLQVWSEGRKRRVGAGLKGFPWVARSGKHGKGAAAAAASAAHNKNLCCKTWKNSETSPTKTRRASRVTSHDPVGPLLPPVLETVPTLNDDHSLTVIWQCQRCARIL